MPNTYLEGLQHQNPTLTGIALGHSQGNLVFSKLFPKFSVPSSVFEIPKTGKDHFRYHDAKRALKGEAPRIVTSMEEYVIFKTEEYALAEEIDYLEIDRHKGLGGLLGLQKQKTKNLVDAQYNAMEMAAAALATDLDNYSADHKKTLVTSGQFTHAESDPMEELIIGIDTVKGTTRKTPDIIVIGKTSMQALRTNAKFRDALYGSTTKGIVTAESLSQILGIEVVEANAVIHNGETGVTSDIWGDKVIIAYTGKSPGQKQSFNSASYGNMFSRRDLTIQTTDKYNNGKVQVVEATSEWGMAILEADSGYIINDTNA